MIKSEIIYRHNMPTELNRVQRWVVNTVTRALDLQNVVWNQQQVEKTVDSEILLRKLEFTDSEKEAIVEEVSKRFGVRESLMDTWVNNQDLPQEE